MSTQLAFSPLSEAQIAPREKQVNMGKARPEYRRYLQVVPREQRRANDAHTPDCRANMSKRSFDRQVGDWRRQLHCYGEIQFQERFCAGTPPGTPPMSESEAEMPRTRSPSPSIYCHRGSAKLVEDNWDVQSCASASTALNTSSTSSACGSDHEEVRSFLTSSRDEDSSDDEEVWCPRHPVSKSSSRVPAAVGLTADQQQHMNKWMKDATCEMALREGVKEDTLRNGMLTVRRLKRSAKGKLCGLKARLENLQEDAAEDGMMHMMLEKLQIMEERVASSSSAPVSRCSSSSFSAPSTASQCSSSVSQAPEILNEMAGSMREMQQVIQENQAIMARQAAEMRLLKEELAQQAEITAPVRSCSADSQSSRRGRSLVRRS